MPGTFPRAAGLKEGHREQVLSGFAAFHVVHIAAHFLEKSLRDCSAGATGRCATVCLSVTLSFLPFLLSFPLPLSPTEP